MDEQLAMKGEYLSAAVVRQIVDKNQQKEQLLQNPIACLRRLVGEYEKNVNRKGKRGIESTKATYLTALGRLEDYDKQRKVPIGSFDDFNKKFFVDFTNYLYEYSYGKTGKHYTQNTIINTLKVIKNLLHRAYDSEMTTNNYFLKVQTTLPADSSEQIYLQEKEIQKLSLAIAPLIEHYQQIGFPVIDKVKANKIIKVLAARCGINEAISRKEYRGGETTIVTIPKYELISFHTARRSCVTNLYKRGYPINYVMSLSGHRSFQAFQRYMRASSKELMTDFVRLLKKEKAILA